MYLITSLSHTDKEVLEKSTVFKNLPADGLAPFLSASEVRIFKTGQIILSSGKAGDGLYVVLEGTVEVFLPQGDMDDDNGGFRVDLATLERGACFGEYSLVDQKEVSASVDAGTSARLFHLSTQDFHQIAKAHPLAANIIYKNLLQLLVSRCREANEELKDDVFVIF